MRRRFLAVDTDFDAPGELDRLSWRANEQHIERRESGALGSLRGDVCLLRVSDVDGGPNHIDARRGACLLLGMDQLVYMLRLLKALQAILRERSEEHTS